MSDSPAGFAPPPPPPNLPPPPPGPPSGPGFAAPAFQAPVAPDYPVPYAAPPPAQQPYPPQAYGQQPYPPQAYGQQPGYYAQPSPYTAAGIFAGGAGGVLYQFGGPAVFSIIAGVASIVMPFAVGYYFIILPIAGLISGARAIQRGRLIGGIVGIAVNILGGLVSLLASGIVGGGS